MFQITMLVVHLVLATLLLIQASTTNFIHPRLTAAISTDRGQFTFIASISWGFPIFVPQKHTCAAIIIHELWLLSSAHCVYHIPFIGFTRVKIGKFFTERDDDQVNVFYIEKTILHEFFTGSKAPNDIALIKLTAPITFGDYIKKVKLPLANTALSGVGVLIGWGSISTTTKDVWPDVLQAAVVPIISSRICERNIQIIQGEIGIPKYIHHTQICTGTFETFTSICIGDAGGPLVQYSNNEPELIGIISWGMYPCGVTKTPSVHTRVSSFVDWIHREMAKHS